MGNRLWPPGIDVHRGKLRIRLFHKSKVIHQELIEADPTKKSHVAAAKRRRDELVSRQKLGLPLYDEVIEPGNRLLFAQAAEQYLKSADLKHSTRKEYARDLDRDWMPSLHNHICDEITKSQILDIIKRMPVKNKTKMNRLGPLKAVLRFAGVDPTPADTIRLRKQQRRRIQRYLPSERERLLASLRGDARVFYAIMFGCGCRPGEVLALRWDRIDGQRMVIDQAISRRELGSVKNEQYRVLHIPEWVLAIINTLPSRFTHSYLFVNQYGRNHKDSLKNFYEPWRKAHVDADIPYRHPYTARHTRAAELLSSGAVIGRAARQMGHSVEMFTRIYSEFIEEFSGEDTSVLEGKPVGNLDLLLKTGTDAQNSRGKIVPLSQYCPKRPK